MADNFNSCRLTNSKFTIFDKLLSEYDWKLNENYFDRVVYLKPGNELDTFEIKIDSTNIYVSVPLKNCDCLYRVKFDDYFSAFDYVEAKGNSHHPLPFWRREGD